jgi:hypothetical protein
VIRHRSLADGPAGDEVPAARTPVTIALAWAACVLSLPLAARAATPAGWPAITPEERALRAVPGDPGAPTVLLRNSRDGRIVQRGADTSNILEYHWRLKILTEAGRRYAEVQIPAGKYSRVGSIEARTIRPDGGVVAVPEDQIFRRLVTRTRGYREVAYVFHFPAVEAGAIVEYRYERVVNNLAFIIPWTFSGPEFTVLSHVSQAIPDDMQYNAMCHHCPDPKPAVTPWREGPEHGRRFEWTVRDVAAVRDGEWMPPERVSGTRLEMVLKSWRGKYWAGIERADTFISDWNTAARFAGYYYQEAIKDGQTVLRGLARDWTAGLEGREAVVGAIVTHVRRDFRYLGGEDVYASTRRIGDIVRDRSADNEEKAVLLAGVLQAAGVPARIALVAGRDHGPMYVDFYSLSQFSHAIVLVSEDDGGATWIDPTVTWAPRDFLPWRDAGAAALLLDGAKGTILGLPQKTDVGLTRYDASLRPLRDGSADVEATVTFTGEDAVEMRDDLIPASTAERHDIILDWLDEASPGSALADFEPKDLEDVDAPLHLRLHIVARGHVTLADEALAIQPCVFDCYAANPIGSGSRTQPFFVDRGRRRMQVVTLIPPDGVTQAVLPDPGSASSALGAMSFGCESKGGDGPEGARDPGDAAPGSGTAGSDATGGSRVECVRAFTLPRSRIEANADDEVRAMFDAIVALDRARVVFRAGG